MQYLAMNRDYNGADSLSMSHLPAGHPEGYYEAFGNIYERFCKDVIARQGGRQRRNMIIRTLITEFTECVLWMPVWKATKRVMSGLHCNEFFCYKTAVEPPIHLGRIGGSTVLTRVPAFYIVQNIRAAVPLRISRICSMEEVMNLFLWYTPA